MALLFLVMDHTWRRITFELATHKFIIAEQSLSFYRYIVFLSEQESFDGKMFSQVHFLYSLWDNGCVKSSFSFYPTCLFLSTTVINQEKIQQLPKIIVHM